MSYIKATFKSMKLSENIKHELAQQKNWITNLLYIILLNKFW